MLELHYRKIKINLKGFLLKKLLLFGPLREEVDSAKAGGVTVLFELLLKELRENNVSYTVIDTYKENYSNVFHAYVMILLKFAKHINSHTHVSIQSTANLLIYIGPIIVFISKIFSKNISIRKFAGNFNHIYENSNFIQKKLIEYVLMNSNINFFETKYLVEYFKKFNTNTFWFPNVRKRQVIATDSVYKSKFIFVGSVNEYKGIEVLCKASNLLTKKYNIDIYGVLDEKYTESFFDDFNVKYKGRLKPENVAKVMSEYDVLVLPTFWQAEGYPGVIIEAFSLGIPVISTKLEGIIEMVEDNKNGLLVDVKNINQLANAIQYINSENYKFYSQNAMESFKNFNSSEKTLEFINKLQLGEINE